jgi:uncharacterized BrkB/YihY/UPF0761 family membrane protein
VQIAGGPAAILEHLTARTAVNVAWLTHAVLLGLMFGLSIFLLGAFYRLAVHRGAPRRVWPGVIATVLFAVLFSAGFAYYVQNLAKFAVFYGSLAAVAVVLGWLYLVSASFLCGAELNVILDQEALLKHGAHRKAPKPPESSRAPAPMRQRAAASVGSTHTPQASGSSADA